MNFFEQQDRARQRTGLLVLLFFCAVSMLIVATCLLVASVFYFTNDAALVSPSSLTAVITAVPPDTLISIACAIVAIVALGSAYKFVQLSKGGSVVAESLGGRLLNTRHCDSSERRLLNVVEEMAIASGVPVPSVYLLDEDGINAFAAGTTIHNAAIGVTRGAVEQLDRDQLQGVIAHEFSHIFNGDMRLNLRLLGVLNGITVFGVVGYQILRVTSRGGLSRSRNNNGALPLLLLGGGLMILGYGGTFFGNLIKSAVSRQREFLADASAVQFSRNPDGIAGALKKIGGYSAGSRVEHPASSELSHLFFGQALSFWAGRLFATHPPLDERIRRIDTGWRKSAALNHDSDQRALVDNEGVASFSSRSSAGAVSEHALLSAVATLHAPDSEQRRYARRILDDLPASVVQAAHEPYGARALVYCLLLDSSQHVRRAQMELLERKADTVVAGMVEVLQSTLCRDAERQLVVLDLALPALHQLSSAQREQFFTVLHGLIHCDAVMDFYEWALYSIVVSSLQPPALLPSRQLRERMSSVRNIKVLGKAVATVVSAVVHAGQPALDGKLDDNAARPSVDAAFDAAATVLGMPHMQLMPRKQVTVDGLNSALRSLSRLVVLQKPRLLKAMVVAAGRDGVLAAAELQLIRAVAQRLDCPMPPLQTTVP